MSPRSLAGQGKQGTNPLLNVPRPQKPKDAGESSNSLPRNEKEAVRNLGPARVEYLKTNVSQARDQVDRVRQYLCNLPEGEIIQNPNTNDVLSPFVQMVTDHPGSNPRPDGILVAALAGLEMLQGEVTRGLLPWFYSLGTNI